MLRLIIDKQLREIIGSRKFALSFAVCATLILLTFLAGIRSHQVNVARNEAAKAENLRQMEGLTDWTRVDSHRIFLPPTLLEALVTGISNDIGRTIEMTGRGDLVSTDSRFNDDPLFAVFRFLDLEFIFQIVFSLFAILFAYDAINGEKERGTLRLVFANPIARDKYILGKLIGSFLALGIPLQLPILFGGLLIMVFGAPMSAGDWWRLATIVLAGLLYFGVFLNLSAMVSSLTKRSSSSFLYMLVLWILVVLIIPRSAVLLAGRAVEVPTTDEMAYKKRKLHAQLWQEDLAKMGAFTSTVRDDPEKIMSEFNEFMEKLAKERDRKMDALGDRLSEERRNSQARQVRYAFGLSRLSPSAVFSLAATQLAQTSIDLKMRFVNESRHYQEGFGRFMLDKTGMNPGGRVIVMKMKKDGEEEEEKPINPAELPAFQYRHLGFKEVLERSLFDLGLLLFYNLAFFAGAFVAFLRYDVR